MREAPAAGAPVPWVNRPQPLYVVPDAKPVVYPHSAPLCRAAQLRVRRGRTAAGLGNELEELVFTNVGAAPCLLRGYPEISAETPSGSREALHPQRGGTYFGPLVPADLAPGGHVYLDLATSRGCDGGRKPPVRYRRLRFALAQGGHVEAEHGSVNEFCGLSMSEFGLPLRYAQPRPAPGTAGTLRARLRLPVSVRAGTVLRYTVTLVNPTATTVLLRPCPRYTEQLITQELGVRHSFALDCDSIQAIPPYANVRYAMRLAVPRRAEGIAKVGWNLATPSGPSPAGSFR